MNDDGGRDGVKVDGEFRLCLGWAGLGAGREKERERERERAWSEFTVSHSPKAGHGTARAVTEEKFHQVEANVRGCPLAKSVRAPQPRSWPRC